MAKIEQFKAFIKNVVAYKKTGCIDLVSFIL